MVKKLLLVTVGTSLLDKKIDTFDPKVLDDRFFKNFSYNKYENNGYPSKNNDMISKFVGVTDSLNIADELKKREKDYKDYEHNPDKFPAEISSMLLHLQDEEYFDFNNHAVILKNNNIEYGIHLLISDTQRCKFCAKAIQYYFNKKIGLNDKLFIPDGNLHIIDKLSENSAEFNNGLQKLLTTINETAENADVYQEIIFNITAGYKGVVPYMVLAGMCYKNSRVIYLYETSKSIIEIPRLPVNFDIAGWNDNRAFLNVLTKIPNVGEIYSSPEKLPLSEEFRSLFIRLDTSISFTPFGIFLREKYKKAKEERALSEFGRGYILADLIRDEGKKDKLKKWINNSQNIWYGDNIPETVDHSRGHCQRLLELAAQIIGPINQKHEGAFLTDDELIVLTLTLWFHDIGHSGRKLIPNFNDEIIKQLLDTRNFEQYRDKYIDISEFPTANRDLHHILGFIEALKEIENFGFYDDDARKEPEVKEVKKDWFLEVGYLKVAIHAYLYHRKKMLELSSKPYEFKFDILITKEIDEEWPLNNKRIRLRLLAALQAFIDECDNSRERAGDAEFKQRRIRQTEKEIETEYEKLIKLYNYANKKSPINDIGEINSVMQLFRNHKKGDFYSYRELLEESKKFDLKIEINRRKVEDLLNDCIEKHHDISSDPLKYEIATTLNKVVFKLIQNWHFDKSDAYRSVFILPAEEFKKDNYIFNIYIESDKYVLDVSPINEKPELKGMDGYTIHYPEKRKNEAVIEICKQYKIVEDILLGIGIRFQYIRWVNAIKEDNEQSGQTNNIEETIDGILEKVNRKNSNN